MVERRAGKLVEIIVTSYVEREICINEAIAKRCSPNIFEVDYFLEQPPQDWIGRSEQLFGNGNHNGVSEYVILLDPLSLVCVGIHKLPFTSKSTILVELTETLFHREELAASFEKENNNRDGFERVI